MPGHDDTQIKNIEPVTGDNWRDFIASDIAVLMLGKKDCEACAKWTNELSDFVEHDTEFSAVRYGKMDLMTRGLAEFKKENAAWLQELDVLPFTVIYSDGVKEKEFAGGGIERLVNRLRNLSAT